MAAAWEGSSNNSSSEDEALQRCREAVWVAPTAGTTGSDSQEKKSKRLVVAKHEHDANELQVTAGFRSHVAKKLGNLLDSVISEAPSKTSTSAESSNGNKEDDDEGFRLFSTSVPGQPAEEPPTLVTRRPVPSSSDSDSELETRLREAAVSLSDLLPGLSAQVKTGQKEEEEKKKEEEEESAGGEESTAVGRKKRRRRRQSEKELQGSGSPSQTNGAQEQDDPQVRVKKRKRKKKRDVDGEDRQQSDFAQTEDHGKSDDQRVKKKKKKREKTEIDI